jgi:NADPH:quinone reductase
LFNDGRGADVVFNAAGGPMFEAGLGLLVHRGRQVEITSPTNRSVSLDLVDFYHNESQLFGVDTLKRDLTSAARILDKLREGFEEGSYHPPVIAKTMPLSDAGKAYELVGQGGRGRVVLKPEMMLRSLAYGTEEIVFEGARLFQRGDCHVDFFVVLSVCRH